MNFRFFPIVICLLLSVLAQLSSSVWSNSTGCNQVCGQTRVQYPFGFSDGCEIKLDCRKSRDIMVGSFLVQNLTSDQIMVSVPATCNRPIGRLSQLFGENFAPTLYNGLLVQNCSASLNDCVIPGRLIRSGVSFESCNSGNDLHNVSCYSEGMEDKSQFLDYEKVLRTGNCTVLISSVTVHMIGGFVSGSGSSAVSLEFQAAELGWWVVGNCSCHPNATCVTVYNGEERKGFRCECAEGYTGDGFAGGVGCREVSHCNAADHILGRCGGTKVLILIGGIFAGASSVVGVAFICYCIRKRSRSLKSQLTIKRLISEVAGNSSVPFYSYKEIERATYGFSEKQQLGTGAFGTVYAGKLHDQEPVAIKKIRYRDHESVEQVLNEIKLLSSVSHPGLLRLLGFCIENGVQILVYEYMPNGTLSQHLQRERGTVLPWTVRLTIAAETAHAIAYLHTAMNPPIYHRDIKSSNILLDYNFKSKVADFGLSRFGMLDDSHISTAPQGTPGYVDPQYHQNFHLSDKSDVYSFGVVLVEIISAMKVVDFTRPHSEINLAALAVDKIGKGRVDEIIDPYLEPNRDAWTLSSVHKMAEIAFRCLAFHHDMRPSMTEVADELEQIRISSWAPLEEHTHMGSSIASSCSSPHHGSERSFRTSETIKKTGVASRRLIVPHREAEEVKDCSPVSVQDCWLSSPNSPSTNTLLANVVQ
ncbi:wall-associated receptor kinase-like 14-like [Dorcoceras hygrometricum]|uniref:Wall-associated receptor kinase-like 14-like n=1 Tax=Dorcoceras hygrometricum TaxID=472368 RepID=A0A2Z7AUR9_9LAMI|nr:wall-associated receptor kinase-like 14-like [Dorcoceras hygrometricum]